MTTKADLARQNVQLLETVELFSERLGELELALEDTDWIRMSIDGSREFSNAGLAKIVMLARLAYLKNPLINRAVSVQSHYVWGQGVNISGKPAEVDAVVQGFLDHPKNKVELTGHQARGQKEISLQLESNIFFVLFTNGSSGRVLVRTIPVDEILAGDIITNPEDAKEPWYYKRVWSQRTFNSETGAQGSEQRTAYYPDWRFRPTDQPDTIGGHPVLWDQPVLHLKVGGLPDMRFGVPEVYAALDWAKAVKEDLERYATLRASLARFAHTLTTKGGSKAVAAAKAKLGSSLGTDGLETNPPPVTGSMFIGAEGHRLEAYRTAGAVPNPNEGRRLGLMVSAGTGIPETMLFGDADVGNLATSKTLDRPTELKMLDRQTLWADTLRDILDYVALQAAKRANGPLAGTGATIETDEDGIETLSFETTDEKTGATITYGIDIDFPAILERDVKDRVDAIVAAATLAGDAPAGIFDLRTLLGLLARALGVDDVDELLDLVAPEDGEEAGWLGHQAPKPATVPGGPPTPPADDQVAEALRDVRDAARALVRVA